MQDSPQAFPFLQDLPMMACPSQAVSASVAISINAIRLIMRAPSSTAGASGRYPALS